MQQPKSVYVITGGGTKFIGELLSKGGASSFVEEIVVPYGRASSTQFLGYTPTKYACERVARDLAVKAYYRCRELINDVNEPALGLGVTCKLAVEGERHNREHQIHIASHRDNETAVQSLLFNPIKDRKKQEEISALLIQQFIDGGDVLLPGIWQLGNTYTKVNTDISDIYAGRKRAKAIIFRDLNPFNIQSSLIFPGSFNPLHHGHIDMARLAYHKMGKPVFFELCIHNTDKPSIDCIELNKRIEEFSDIKEKWFGGLIISNTPRFIDKIENYFNPIFLTGTDTLQRILHHKYYDNVLLALDKLKYTTFLHFQRKDCKFVLPANCEKIRIINMEYHDDGISSTVLREKI